MAKNKTLFLIQGCRADTPMYPEPVAIGLKDFKPDVEVQRCIGARDIFPFEFHAIPIDMSIEDPEYYRGAGKSIGEVGYKIRKCCPDWYTFDQALAKKRYKELYESYNRYLKGRINAVANQVSEVISTNY